MRAQAALGREGWVSPDRPGIFAANSLSLAEWSVRKSGRRSARGHPSLLATGSVDQLFTETASARLYDGFSRFRGPASAGSCCRGSRHPSAGMFGDMQSDVCGGAAACSPRSEAEGRSIPEEGCRLPPYRSASSSALEDLLARDLGEEWLAALPAEGGAGGVRGAAAGAGPGDAD